MFWLTLELILAFALGAAVAAGVARRVQRRTLARVRDAERRARGAERLAEIGAMTGGLAHEIKNPLSTIGLNAQLLAEGIDELPVPPEDKGRLTRRVHSLRREVDRLRGILTDFLEYAGELRLDRRPADLNQVVEELVDFFLPQAERSSVRLRADTHPHPLRVTIDVPHVKQAVLNLMLNAVQAMSAPTPPHAQSGEPTSPDTSSHASRTDHPRELIIKTCPAPTPPGRTRSTTDLPMVQLHVIDTGPGIPPQTLERIFTPYFTTKGGGSGLGLPTARRLIEAHEGRLEVVTELHKGTDFIIHLPATP